MHDVAQKGRRHTDFRQTGSSASANPQPSKTNPLSQIIISAYQPLLPSVPIRL
eukprot:c33798_g1_i1 orf=1-156(-)